MRHSIGFATTSEALQRVFVLNLQRSPTQVARAVLTSRPIPPQCLRHPTPSSYRLHQYRHASTSRMGGYMASVHDSKAVKGRPNHPPRDEEITAPKVYLIRSLDQSLPEPIDTQEVLESRKRDEKGRVTQTLKQVALHEVEEGIYYPICRMIGIKATREREDADRKAKKEKKIVRKQLECGWTMSDNDLGHRLRRLKDFMKKGWRVEVLFGTKRKGWMEKRAPSAEEISSVLSKIRAAVGEVEGARELREMQGEGGGEAKLAFEGRPKK